MSLLALGAAQGLVNFGFLLWLPSNLRRLGLDAGTSAGLLADSVLVSLPAIVVVAWLYGAWSSRRTTVVLAALNVLTLATFVVLGDDALAQRWVLVVLVVLVLASTSALLAVLAPYTAEAYPTAVRARASGLVASASKAGGVAGIGLAALSLQPPSLRAAALLGAVPVAVALVAIARCGVETSRRPLDPLPVADGATARS